MRIRWLLTLILAKAGAAAAPAPVYHLPVPPLQLVAEEGQFAPFARAVRDDVDALLQANPAPDGTRLRLLLGLRVHLALHFGEDATALTMAERIRQMQPDPAGRALVGLSTRAFVQARQEAGRDHPQEFAAAFERDFAKLLQALPPEPAMRDAVRRARFKIQAATRAGLLDELRKDVLPRLARGEACDIEMAERLVSVGHRIADMVPLREGMLRAYDAVLAAPPEPQADVIIYGATPGGIATAVRAAREGLRVTLVNPRRHVGGMMANGLGVYDTTYAGWRAPLFDEVFARIIAYYRDHYGVDSPQYLASIWPEWGRTREPTYEPRVAEVVFEEMLAAEKNVRVLREFRPVKVEKSEREIVTATFRSATSPETRTLAAPAFVDASYEGDLAAMAGVSMTSGREARGRFDEPHAGRVFTHVRFASTAAAYFPTAMRTEGLNLRGFVATSGPLLTGSTGEADDAIQAYNFRVCLTRNPANRLAVGKPARYERDLYLLLRERWDNFGRQPSLMPNDKCSWNAPILIGGSVDYPNGSWDVREAISARHRDFALGLLWFLQHDDAVPELIRQEALAWGLPKDEFTDNDGFPWEVYVREARRLIGRSIFTEHDALPAPGIRRAPPHPDSIAVTDWPLDSHACHFETSGNSDHEGKVLLTEETRPAQVSYGCVLPREVDNLLVTGCLSSSHIGWGALRLEPTWMHIGESAGYALVLARNAAIPPARLATEKLQRTLVQRGVMLSFFNDFDLAAPTPAQRAAQYFGPRGFFPSYDAYLDAPLTPAVAKIWARPAADALTTAQCVATAENSTGTLTAAEFAALAGGSWAGAPDGPLTRGAACAWLFSRLAPAP
jgi:hypothetical protein